MTETVPPDGSADSAVEVAATPEYEAICASEDLAHIGAIQGFGFILIGNIRSETLVQLSRNAPAALGGAFTDQSPERLLGTRMRTLVGSAWAQGLRLTSNQSTPQPVPLADAPAMDSADWLCRVHRSGEMLLMEFMPAGRDLPLVGELDLRESVARLTDTDTVGHVVDTAAEVFRTLTGFDRVMIYRFLPDWSGEVIAESCRDGLPVTYLGNRFPAGDIPPQARALYDEMGVRLIADTNLGTAALTPMRPTGATDPIDMSRCLIRAVSRAHIEYLKNMGIRQSMSVAIHVEERLWGLVACHQEAAHPLQLPTFSTIIGAVERMAALVESRLAEQLDHDRTLYRNAVQDAVHRMLTTARAVGYKRDLLIHLLDELRWNEGYSCIGVVVNDWSIVIRGEDDHDEHSKLPAQLADLCQASQTRHGQAMLETRDCRSDFPLLETDPATMGLLAYRPIEFQRVTVFVGLPETTETIAWAGNPDVVRKQEIDGQVVISPRSSFAQWHIDERGRSRFWHEDDRKTLFQLADALRVWVTSAERAH